MSDLPQPDDIGKVERDDAMGAYLMMFAAWGIGLPLPILNLLAAFIYHMVNRRRSRFVAFHSLQSLSAQVPVTALNVTMIVWLVRTIVAESAFAREFWIALIFVGLVNIGYIVVSLVALGHARRGQFYYIPVFGRLAYERYFGPNAVDLERTAKRPNRPPPGY